MKLIIENEGDAELAARIVRDLDRAQSCGLPKHLELLCINEAVLHYVVTLLDDGYNNGSKENYTNLEIGFFHEMEEDAGDGDDSGGSSGTSNAPDEDGPFA